MSGNDDLFKLPPTVLVPLIEFLEERLSQSYFEEGLVSPFEVEANETIRIVSQFLRGRKCERENIKSPEEHKALCIMQLSLCSSRAEKIANLCSGHNGVLESEIDARLHIWSTSLKALTAQVEEHKSSN